MSNLETMEKKDLKEYAETLDIKVLANDSAEVIRSKINGHNGVKTTASTADAVAQLEDEESKVGKGVKAKDGDRELKVIFNPGTDGNQSNVLFGINGTMMSLPRNKEVTVKKKYLDMLSKECFGFSIIQTNDPMTGQILTEQVKVPTYTFQIVG